jgi:hypothetical protein
MLKKVKLTFVGFSKAALPLDQEVLVVGSMSVVSAGGFENGLPCAFRTVHNPMVGFVQDLRFLIAAYVLLNYTLTLIISKNQRSNHC